MFNVIEIRLALCDLLHHHNVLQNVLSKYVQNWIRFYLCDY